MGGSRSSLLSRALILLCGSSAAACGSDAGICIVEPLEVRFESPITESYFVALNTKNARALIGCDLSADPPARFVLEEGGLGEGTVLCREDGFAFEPSQEETLHVTVESREAGVRGEASSDVALDGGCPARFGPPVDLEWEPLP